MAPRSPVKQIDYTSVGLSDVAHILGLTVDTMRRWREKGCPCIEEPKKIDQYSVPAVFQWMLNRERLNGKRGNKPLSSVSMDPGDDEEMEEGLDGSALERYRRIRGDLGELELANKRKLLVEVAVVRQMLGGAADTIRQQLQSLGRKICTRVAKINDPERVSEMLTTEFEGVLQRLAEKSEEVL